MESMARSISTHSLRMAFGSRGADAGGLTRLCISTSPVEERERESQIGTVLGRVFVRLDHAQNVSGLAMVIVYLP